MGTHAMTRTKVTRHVGVGACSISSHSVILDLLGFFISPGGFDLVLRSGGDCGGGNEKGFSRGWGGQKTSFGLHPLQGEVRASGVLSRD